jgi:hypothetical protein
VIRAPQNGAAIRALMELVDNAALSAASQWKTFGKNR